MSGDVRCMSSLSLASPLIGRDRSRDLNTDLSLAETRHKTLVIFGTGDGALTSLALIGPHWSRDLNTGL